MKKKILSIFLVAVMLLSTLSVFPITIGADGANTFNAADANPQITTAADMVAFRDAVNAGTSFDGKTVSLKADIDLGAALGWWDSIGTKDNPFIGNFDGEGHTVNIKREGGKIVENGGLFGYVRAGDNGSSVQNLKLTGRIVASGGGAQKFGAVVSMVDANNTAKKGTVTINNVWSAVYIDSSGSEASVVGGIVGGISGVPETGEITLNITNCVFSGYIGGPSAGQKNHGCILGWTGEPQSNRTLNMENCVVTGMLDIYKADDNDNGGFVGAVKSSGGGSYNAPLYSTFTDLVFAGKIKPKNTSAGDESYIVGWLGANSIVKQADFENCYYVVRSAGGGHTVTTPLSDGKANATKLENVTEKTLNDLSAMTAGSNFTDDSEWVFGKSFEGYNETLNVPIPRSIYYTFIATDPYSANDEFIVDDAADLVEIDANVTAGKNYAGKTIKLANDITLPADFDGIGVAGMAFAGTFDGQGHTITCSEHIVADDLGSFFIRIDGATVKDVNFDGKVIMDSDYAAVIACSSMGDCLIENVRVSTYMQANKKNIYYAGGFIAIIASNKNGNVTFDSCVFDGVMNFTNYAKDCGAFMAYTGILQSSNTKTVTLKSCVYAGTMMFNGHEYTQYNGCFIGYAYQSVKVTVEDCYSIGKMTFAGGTYEKTLSGVVLGDFSKSAGYKPLTVKNFYYVEFANENNTGKVGLTFAGNDPSVFGTITNVNAVTLADIAALTADDFSANAKFTFKANDLNDYYPCPTGLVPAEGWIASLAVIYDGARFIGAQIRCTDPADKYAGIRFVTAFDATKVENAGTADANFGVILVSQAKYKELSDKNNVAALEAVGVKVAATQVDVDGGIYTVKAVVYNISADNYCDEIVAVAYIGDTVVDSGSRSIFSVAEMCVKDATASDMAKSFSQQIIDTVNGN